MEEDAFVLSSSINGFESNVSLVERNVRAISTLPMTRTRFLQWQRASKRNIPPQRGYWPSLEARTRVNRACPDRGGPVPFSISLFLIAGPVERLGGLERLSPISGYGAPFGSAFLLILRNILIRSIGSFILMACVRGPRPGQRQTGRFEFESDRVEAAGPTEPAGLVSSGISTRTSIVLNRARPTAGRDPRLESSETYSLVDEPHGCSTMQPRSNHELAPSDASFSLASLAKQYLSTSGLKCRDIKYKGSGSTVEIGRSVSSRISGGK